MTQRSRIELLPDAVLNELNERLVKGRFSGYDELTQWLKDQGLEISRSALHRYGQKFEDKLAALKLSTDQARAVVTASPDDEGAMNEALMRLIQEKLFGILIDMNIDVKRINISSLTKSVAELARASVTQKKYAETVKEKANAAAASIERIAKKGGLSKGAVAEIRREILGIPA